MNKKIIFVCQKVTYDGASKMLNWTVNKLAEIPGNNVSLYTFYYSKTNYCFDENVKWHQKIREKNERWKIIFDLRSYLKREKPDMVVSFLYDAGVYSLLATIGLQIPVIVCERTDPNANKLLNIKFAQAMYRMASGAVFQLPAAQQYFKNIIKKKTCVIPNPVFDTGYTVSLPFEQRRDVISYVGRISNFQKRLDLLISAFSIYAQKNKTVKLELYGDGEDMEAIKRQIEALNMQERIVVKGSVSNPMQYVSTSKCYILSSDFEGIPNSLLEAMSVGVPVISTDTSPGGARFLISNNQNGLLVKCGDINMLADKMDYLFNNPQKADDMGKNAKQVLERFKEDNIAKMWDSYLNTFM